MLEQRLSLVTLGCADLARAKAFYKDVLGWRPFMEMDDIAFFDLGGLCFALWTEAGLRADMMREAAPGSGVFRGISLAHNLRSEAEVDSAFAKLEAAGVQILKPPHRADWGGYSGYFADPDGNAWELAFNPMWPIDADGRLRLSAPQS
ncbi:MAG: VOC family protein [Hyphomonadaceae bacterium]